MTIRFGLTVLGKLLGHLDIHLELDAPTEAAGAELVRHAARRTVKDAVADYFAKDWFARHA